MRAHAVKKPKIRFSTPTFSPGSFAVAAAATKVRLTKRLAARRDAVLQRPLDVAEQDDARRLRRRFPPE